ncbi:MAG: type II toxin-antitoxin system RelE/ParE family toxin [Leptospirales bacterium]
MIKLFRPFRRWQRKIELPDKTLIDAVSEMERGLIDAELGGHLFKKRIPLPGRGKRGSVRTFVANKRDGPNKYGDNWFFLAGFEKNDQDNIDDKEENALKLMADALVQMNNAKIKKALSTEALGEVSDDTEDTQEQEKPNH